MNERFEAITAPTREQIDALTRITPYTPFNTYQYADACARFGEKPFMLVQWAGPNMVAGCLCCLKGHFLSRLSEIVTAPSPPNPALFWSGVWNFCRKHGVWELNVESFGSESTNIPSMPGEINRRTRYENILDLTTPDFLSNLSSNHRYNLKRARKASLAIRRTRGTSACQLHIQLMHQSKERRTSRGEDVLISSDPRFFEALLNSGAGELFQALLKEKVLSSILIVRSPESAYSHSAGNSPEGMNCGASAFLFSEIARILKQEGVRLFNLGGGDPAVEGLRRFKAGFGGREVMLEAVTFSMVSPALRQLRKVAHTVLYGPGEFFKSFKSVFTKVKP